MNILKGPFDDESGLIMVGEPEGLDAPANRNMQGGAPDPAADPRTAEIERIRNSAERFKTEQLAAAEKAHAPSKSSFLTETLPFLLSLAGSGAAIATGSPGLAVASKLASNVGATSRALRHRADQKRVEGFRDTIDIATSSLNTQTDASKAKIDVTTANMQDKSADARSARSEANAEKRAKMQVEQAEADRELKREEMAERQRQHDEQVAAQRQTNTIQLYHDFEDAFNRDWDRRYQQWYKMAAETGDEELQQKLDSKRSAELDKQRERYLRTLQAFSGEDLIGAAVGAQAGMDEAISASLAGFNYEPASSHDPTGGGVTAEDFMPAIGAGGAIDASMGGGFEVPPVTFRGSLFDMAGGPLSSKTRAMRQLPGYFPQLPPPEDDRNVRPPSNRPLLPASISKQRQGPYQ